MSKENRVLTPHCIKSITQRLNQDRSHLLTRVEKVMKDTTVFAMAASNAVGEISYAEAVEGIIEFFRDEMRKVS